MAHAVALGLQVEQVVFVGLNFNVNSRNDFKIVSLKAYPFNRIVGDQAHFGNTKAA